MLGIDFGTKTYSTQLSMSAEGTGVQSFSQAGSINPNTGVFLGGSSAVPTGNSSSSSNVNSANTSSLAGAISLDARQAGYLFKNPTSRGTFTGATLWGR